MASDLSHISTPAKVEGYLPPDDGLKKALTGASIVVIPAGVPRKPGVRNFCTGYSFAWFNFVIDDSVSLGLVLSDETFIRRIAISDDLFKVWIYLVLLPY